MKRKNISVVISAGEKVCFCYFIVQSPPNVGGGKKDLLHSFSLYNIWSYNILFFSLYLLIKIQIPVMYPPNVGYDSS
jgi:hypothetical protein